MFRATLRGFRLFLGQISLEILVQSTDLQFKAPMNHFRADNVPSLMRILANFVRINIQLF